MGEGAYTVINGTPYVWKTTYAKRDFYGSALPDVYGSFNASLSWKGLSLSALFTYSLGGYTYDNVYAGLMSATGSPSSLHRDLLKSWSSVPDGMTEDSPNRIDPNGIPEINYENNSDNNAGTCSRWLTDASYLVIKNVALSYELPRKWAQALKMQGITVSATCENLATFTARQGMNPQQTFSGYQYNYLPTARIYSAGISFKF